MSDDCEGPRTANPAGEAQNGVLHLDFDRRVMVRFRGSVVTSDAGLLAYRELDDVLGLSEMAGEYLADARTGKNGRHALVGLLRQSVFGRLAGYEDVNDADRLRHDPAMRLIVGGKAAKGRAASPSQMGRFETQWLAASANLSALANLSGNWIDRARKSLSNREIVLDMDSSVSPTHGEQEQSVWNGHFGCTCYHPLFVFNQFGDLERCALRPGNVHSADGWEDVLKPVIARYQGAVDRIAFRGDAAFAQPGMYEFLESERIEYAIRLPANKILQARISHLLTRPVGRPPHYVKRFYKSFHYKAASWSRPRRVVAKVKWHLGELFPRVGFIVTNLRYSSKSTVRFYNKRGTAEQWIKEGKGRVARGISPPRSLRTVREPLDSYGSHHPAAAPKERQCGKSPGCRIATPRTHRRAFRGLVKDLYLRIAHRERLRSKCAMTEVRAIW